MSEGQNIETMERDTAVVREQKGDVAILRLSRPPVNTLSQDLRKSLSERLREAEANPEVKAIVLTAEGASFCTGFAPDKLVAQEPAPSLNTLCDQIDGCSKPVVAALFGSTLEAGVALALASHYRVMGRSARLGTPEISFGLVPTGGVTQILPRLLGAGPALELLLSGRPIAGAEAEKFGLVDRLVSKDVGAAAVSFAQELADQGKGPRSTRDARKGLSDGAHFFKEIAAHRTKIRGERLEAPNRVIDCVEAALMLPFDAGRRRETIAREDCFETEESKALRHAFFAERRAGRLIGAQGAKPREVKTFGLVGTGPLALGIAIAALDHGMKVQLLGASADQLVMAQQRIATTYTRATQQGQITEEIQRDRLANLTVSTRVDSLSGVDLVLDATTNSVEGRARLLARVEEFLSEDVVVATVSDRGFARLSQDLAHPERLLGLHFFAPAQAIRVVELARPDGVRLDALATAHAFLRRIGKLPVTMQARDGLIANLVQEAGWAAVDVLLLMGAGPARIDRAMRDYGFPSGPCETMDALGLTHMSGAVAQFLVSEGRTGKEAGHGFYDYAVNTPPNDAAVEEILRDLRRQGGIPVARLSDRDICDRIILAEANSGARLLQSGTVEHPVDIDVVMMVAKGYPRYRGGPMKAAELMGILGALKRLNAYAQSAPDIWQPATIWRELLKNGDDFEKLNLL